MKLLHSSKLETCSDVTAWQYQWCKEIFSVYKDFCFHNRTCMYKAAISVNFEQRASYRDRADCCHTTPSSHQIRKEMAAMTCHSIKMERQSICTLQFEQDLSDLNFPSKSTGTDGTIAWPSRSLYPTTLDFFLLGYAEDPVYVPPLQPTTHAATWCQDESNRG